MIRSEQWMMYSIGAIMAITLMAIMLLTFIDVLGRYIFAAPLPGAFELTQLGMGVIVFSGLPLVGARDGHVAITIGDRLVPEQFKPLQAATVQFIAAGMLGLFAWQIFIHASRLRSVNESTMFLGIPIAPVAFFIFAMAVLAALVALVSAVVGGSRSGSASGS